MLGINDIFRINVKIKRVVGVLGIMWMAAKGLGPADDLAHIFNNDFTFSQVLHCENTFTMHARAAGLNTAVI